MAKKKVIKKKPKPKAGAGKPKPAAAHQDKAAVINPGYCTIQKAT